MESWIYGFPKNKKDEAARWLKELNFSFVIMDWNRENIDLALGNGLKVYVCVQAYSRNHFGDEKYLSMDINGNRQVWFRSTCPNQKEVQQFQRHWISQMLEKENVEGIFLDGIRFASPASGRDAFFTCFCSECQKKAEIIGFNFEKIKKDVSALYRFIQSGQDYFLWKELLKTPLDLLPFLGQYPGVFDWLLFRRECTTAYIRDISRLVREKGKNLGVYFFSPSLSFIVGQSYFQSRNLVDIFSPMIYRKSAPNGGPAGLNSELTGIVRMFGENYLRDEQTLAIIPNLLGWGKDIISMKNIVEELPVEIVGMETNKARLMLGENSQLVPIIWLDDSQLNESVRAVINNGADGVAFFAYQEELEERILAGVKAMEECPP